MSAPFAHSSPLFDPVAFGAAIARKIAINRMSYRDVEKLTGADHNTIYRVVAGKPPNVENYLRLKLWLETKD